VLFQTKNGGVQGFNHSEQYTYARDRCNMNILRLQRRTAIDPGCVAQPTHQFLDAGEVA